MIHIRELRVEQGQEQATQAKLARIELASLSVHERCRLAPSLRVVLCRSRFGSVGRRSSRRRWRGVTRVFLGSFGRFGSLV